MLFISIVIQLGVVGGVAASCNADNCLRALRNPTRLSAAQSFCGTFTTAAVPVTVISAVPSYAVDACTGDVVGRVSSACSCIAPQGTSTTLVTSSTTSVSTSTTSAPTSSPTGFPQGPKKCEDNKQLSCHNTTVVEDLCCFNAPGGQLLLTQFWDTAPSTGPNNSWTLHGLWPDHCDGTYDANCDASREYTNITAILNSYGKTDLLAYMNVYWKDYQGNDESFWEHEWDKHGTCISTLEPHCYNGYTGQEEVADYFELAVSLFKGLDSYSTLEKAGIIPSTTTTYTSAQIQDALSSAHGYPVSIMCSSGALDEIWYHYNVLGSVQTGQFIATSPDGSKSDCPSTGIKYIPKYLPAATTTTSAGPTGTPVNTPFAGRGYLQAQTGGVAKGCLISAGTWYTTGTCATYSAASSGEGFTLTSSKGPCDIIADTFSCAAGNTAGIFTNIAGSLGYAGTSAFYAGTSAFYAGTSAFYAAAIPVGSVQQKVFTTVNEVPVSFIWQSI